MLDTTLKVLVCVLYVLGAAATIYGGLNALRRVNARSKAADRRDEILNAAAKRKSKRIKEAQALGALTVEQYGDIESEYNDAWVASGQAERFAEQALGIDHSEKDALARARTDLQHDLYWIAGGVLLATAASIWSVWL